MPTFKVRDLRHKQYFIIDDTYLNGYAKHLDPVATVVYISLCRHADKDQTCFPSQELIAQEHGIGRRTVIDKIALLERWNMIRIERQRNADGKWSRNTYYLLDKSEWIPLPSATDAHGQPSADDDKNHVQMTAMDHVQQMHTKDTHINIKDKEYKERHRTPTFLTSLTDQEIEELQKKFPTLTATDIRYEAEKAYDWISSKGRAFKDYKAFLRNWLRRTIDDNRANGKADVVYTQEDLAMRAFASKD